MSISLVHDGKIFMQCFDSATVKLTFGYTWMSSNPNGDLFMKLILFMLMSLSVAVAEAKVVKFSCDQAEGNAVSRPESVAAVTYTVDPMSLAGKLGCAVKKKGHFCKSIRMDLSKFEKAEVAHDCVDYKTVLYSFDFFE